jgi:RHS repeat-associated protein
VRRIETAYNKRGDVERITSFDSATAGSGNVVNEVFVLYNGFGQAIDTFQSHSGAVNLSTTPSVQMAFADGSANTIRPTGVTYPDGRKITFDYGAADSIHDQCSLVSSLIDSDTGETHLADYQYLGSGTVVLQDSPQADLRYTLVSLTGSNDPDTGDIYSGLDRFGRVKDLRWRNTDTGSDLSRVLYGYDRASSRIRRENPSDSSRRYDWLYGYDGLHRLHSAERGELNSGHTSITTPQFGQCWTLDPTGNWQGFRQDDDGNSTWDLIQARTSNPVNEITDIDNSTGPSWVTPSYDANGNMTTIPRPDLGTDKAMTATWDSWNRLAKLVDPDTSDTLAEFAYDGRNFRVVGKSFTGGTLDETRHFFFTDSWQCLEERIDSSTDPERQHVWGVRYIDDLVLRDRDTTGNGTLDERLYFLPDANWNVTAVVDESGAVQERIEYTPYGWPQFLSPTFGTRTVSSFDVRYTYTSREWEGVVGIYYFRNRWYAPTLGVFCSRDPIGYEGSKWSLYEYVGSHPFIATDPEGQKWDCIACACCAGAAGITCAILCSTDHWDEHGESFASCFGKCIRATPGASGTVDAACGTACTLCAGRGRISVCPPRLRRQLQNGVQKACKRSRRCDRSMSCAVLKAREKINQLCAKARDAINYGCYLGGNKGHRIGADDARRAVARCARIRASKGCP